MAETPTPRPWRTIPVLHLGPSVRRVLGAGGERVALIATAADAELVLRAVNAHGDLLAALVALYTFPGVRGLLAPSGSLGSIADQVEAAIARATEATP